MAFENIEIEYGNFTVNRLGATFFTMDHVTNTLIEKDNNGSVVFNYLLAVSIFEVQSLQTDRKPLLLSFLLLKSVNGFSAPHLLQNFVTVSFIFISYFNLEERKFFLSICCKSFITNRLQNLRTQTRRARRRFFPYQ